MKYALPIWILVLVLTKTTLVGWCKLISPVYGNVIES